MPEEFKCNGVSCLVFKLQSGKWATRVTGGVFVYAGYKTRKAAIEAMSYFV